MPEAVRVAGERLEISLGNDWGSMDEYRLFLKTKRLPESSVRYDRKRNAYTVTAPARFAGLFGVDPGNVDYGFLPPASYLHDYQRWIVHDLALPQKRFAVWADTGLGKTAMFLEWARQVLHKTGGRVLIVSPLNIIPQTIAEAERWYGDALPMKFLKDRGEMGEWLRSGSGLAITNYQKFIPENGREQIPDVNTLAGIVLDESSILKTGGGDIKWSLVKSCKGIEYKLSCTATPAPNDAMEYASQASWLEKLRNENEIIWTYFKKQPDGTWKLLKNAEDGFFRFMSGWSIYLRNPAAYGFRDNLKDLPPPEIVESRIDPTPEQIQFIQSLPDMTGQCGLFTAERPDLKQRLKLSQAAKGFVYDGSESRYRRIASHKPGLVASLARDEMDAGRQVLVWTEFDAESDLIMELLDASPGVEALTGKTPLAKRPDIIARFRCGETRCLVSRAKVLGYGMNFQFCRAMIFSGWSDSFESFYQAVRRCYRYGQTGTVRVHIPLIPELEGVVLDNVRAKEARFAAEVGRQEKSYIKAQGDILHVVA